MTNANFSTVINVIDGLVKPEDMQALIAVLTKQFAPANPVAKPLQRKNKHIKTVAQYTQILLATQMNQAKVNERLRLKNINPPPANAVHLEATA